MLSISEPVCQFCPIGTHNNPLQQFQLNFLPRKITVACIEGRNNESHCFLIFGIISPTDLHEMMQLCLTFPAFFTP